MPIRKVKDGFKIENVSGVSKTKKDALKRLRAIKSSDSDMAARRPNSVRRISKGDSNSKSKDKSKQKRNNIKRDNNDFLNGKKVMIA